MDVWNENVSGDDMALVKLLAQKAEKISGYPAEPEIVQAFLKSALKKGARRKNAAVKVARKKPVRRKNP